MRTSILKRSTAIAGLAIALALGACTTATPYQPATNSGSARGGYTDQQIDSNRFRVTFAGNSLTSRETVERYLLYRAAELTVQNGFDNFILVTRDTDTKTQTYSSPSFSGGAWGGGYYGGWHPYWRWYRPSFGWRSWDPFYDDPFWDRGDFDVRTVQQFEATAEIVVGKGPRPDGNVRAFDAHEVLNRLGPTIQAPPAK
jgi:hypothetical protein